MSEQNKVQERLTHVEDRLERLESILTSIDEKLEKSPQSTAMESGDTDKFQQWVTDYVSMRLQQLVPETCDHPTEAALVDGPFLDNTNVPCTEEVVHRVKRIPIPFVREMVVQRVAENARSAQIDRVDIDFFEEAATF